MNRSPSRENSSEAFCEEALLKKRSSGNPLRRFRGPREIPRQRRLLAPVEPVLSTGATFLSHVLTHPRPLARSPRGWRPGNFPVFPPYTTRETRLLPLTRAHSHVAGGERAKAYESASKTVSERSFTRRPQSGAGSIPPYGIQADAGAGLAVSYASKETG